MGINVYVTDRSTNRGLRVGEEQTLGVYAHPHPPIDEEVSALPFVSYFTLDNDGTTRDMNVDGSSVNKRFVINANGNNDLFLKTVIIKIADAGATLSEFGNLAALTNGLEFVYTNIVAGTVVIADAVKTNFELFRLASGNPSVEIYSNIDSTSEGIIAVINLEQTFGLPYGLRLVKNSTDKLSWVVKDNLSTIDAMDIIGYGIKI
jgi:hypothetical protein